MKIETGRTYTLHLDEDEMLMLIDSLEKAQFHYQDLLKSGFADDDEPIEETIEELEVMQKELEDVWGETDMQDEWEIRADYGEGMVTCGSPFTDIGEAKKELAEYREAEPTVVHTLRKIRAPKNS